MENKKLKVLWFSDSPTTATGFATVAKNLLKMLYATGKYEFTIIGINHAGQPYDRGIYPYDIYPAANALTQDSRYQDVYGRQIFLDMATTGTFDIVFILQDTFIVETFAKTLVEIRDKLPKEKQFAMIYYFPIDGPPKKSWIETVTCKVDIPVAYTQYAKKECMKLANGLENMKVIYHGVDKSIFFPPIDDGEFRKQFLTQHAHKFIILNVNRNQPRKDLHRTLAGFSLFHKKYPDSFLFMLCQANDVGGNLIEIAEHYGLKWDVDWACPGPGTYGANQGYPVEIVNAIYGACDLVISTTVGEGWGLSYSEACACKKPTLFAKNTSLVEMIGEKEERGYFIKSGETIQDFICMGHPDNNILRPICDVFDMASMLEHIYLNRQEAEKKAQRAYNEIWTWDTVKPEWLNVFETAERLSKAIRGETKVGVNDLCPCGSGKKYKKCHGT